MSPISSSCLNTIDSNVRAYQAFTSNGLWNAYQAYITVRQRSLNYEFFPYFHPYVAANRAVVPGM
jgi:hypothetical protein